MSATPLVTVHDILHHVVSHLAADLDVPTPESLRFDVDDSGSDAARQALARLARAHTTFTQPALAALWRFLPSDQALKHLLCVLGIAQRPTGDDEHAWITPPMKLLGTPVTHPSSWARFQEYASLVRKITIDPSVSALDFRAPGTLRQETFWSQVSSALDDEPILPRLEAATLFSLNPFALFDFDMGALCLVTPSLRELNVICPGVGPAERSNFQTVLSICLPFGHDLEVLSVVVPVAILEVAALPQQYPRLRHLKIDEDGIRLDQLALFATLPNLEHLSIVLSPYPPLDRPITFPKLRSLDVFSYDFSGVGLLIAHVNAPRLRSISISEIHGGCDKTYPQALSNHLSTLVTKSPFLSAFRWVSRDSNSFVPPHAHTRTAPDTSWTLAALLAPLLSALPTMRRFSALFTRPPIPCSHLDFQKIAESWPALEEFSLSVSGGGGGGGVDPGLESLTSFARHCPRLRTLRVPSVKFDPDDAAVVLGGPHSRLRELSIGNVVLTSTEFEEATRQGKMLRSLMQQPEIFPSAKISFPIRAALERRGNARADEDGEEVDEDEDEDEDDEEDEDEDMDSVDDSGSENMKRDEVDEE
ncbi:hypothetical protein V8D89_010221 [Ganoderma adspersum]